jgi:hypothetical protein
VATPPIDGSRYAELNVAARRTRAAAFSRQRNERMEQEQAKRVKTGGRQAGTPNKATQKLKTFLDEVFEAAFTNEGFKAELLVQITTLTIDGRLLQLLLQYWAGFPAKQIDHTHTGKLTLEQLVAGVAVDDDADGDELAS